MARLTRFLAVAALILAVLIGAGYGALVYYARQPGPATEQAAAPGAKDEAKSGDEKGVLAAIIERALSTPGMRVNVGAVDGALSSDALIRDVTISDDQGVWLRLDRARLIWSRAALLRGQLLVNRLEIGHLEFLRKPQPTASAETPASVPSMTTEDTTPSLTSDRSAEASAPAAKLTTDPFPPLG